MTNIANKPPINRLMRFITMRSAFYCAAFMGVVVFAVVVGFLSYRSTQAKGLVIALENSVYNDLYGLINRDISNHILLTSRIISNTNENPQTPISKADLDTLSSAIPGLMSLSSIDSQANIIWSIGSQPMTNQRSEFTERIKPQVLLSLQSDKRNTQFIPEFTATSSQHSVTSSVQNARLIILLPRRSSSHNQSGILLLLKLQPLIESRLPNIVNSDISISLLLNDQVIYQSNNQSAVTDASFIRRSFESHSNEWSILMSTPYTPPTITFRIIVGIAISTLFAILIYQILVNRIRTQEFNQKTKQLKTLFENLPGVAYRMLFNVDKGIEEHVEFLSEGFFPLSGYHSSDIESGKLNLLGLIHETDREMAIEKVKRAIVDNQMYDFECRFRNKNGDYMWVWHRGRAVDKTDSGLVFIEGLVTDITSKKHAELALLEARAYAEAIVDTAIEGVILIDSQGTITSFNASAEHIFGYHVDEVKGQNVKLLMPDNIKQEHDNYLKRYKNTNEAKIIGIGREMLAIRKNGELFPIDLSVSEVFHQKSRTFVGLIRDISKQRAAEDEARLHRDQLAHIGRLNALGEMASGIAHEINQPLTSISLFAQAGKRFLQAGSVEEASQAFDKLSQHAHRAGAIIERIQGMAKHHQTEKVLTHCQVLLTEAAALGESEARIYDIKMVIKVEPELPPVLVDAIQIQQVVLNLIRNAIQAMRAVHCKYGNVITIMARPSENGNIDIVVVDSGHGVSQQAEARLFDPFSSTKGQAMGMGLSISRAIVEAHGGQIYFKNNRGFGATFFFSLPVAGKSE